MEIRQASLDELLAVLTQIPEMQQLNDVAALQARIGERPYLALVAYRQQQPVACKLGYEWDQHTFYSWLGGVLPEQRRSGLAQRLLEQQQLWARQHGYQTVRVKSMNRYPNMLRLLINNGYQIVDYEHRGSPDNAKIHFAKSL